MAHRKALPIGVVVLIGAGVFAWFLTPSRRLLDRWVLVCEAKGWEIDRGPDSCKAFFWTVSDDVVHMVDGRSGRGFCRTDLRTGKSSRLDSLSRILRLGPVDPDEVSGSPDGRWAAWYGPRGWITAASTDGQVKRFRMSPNGLGGVLLWQSDSRGLIELDYDRALGRYAAARVYRLHSAEPARVIGIPPRSAVNREGSYRPSRRVAGKRLLQVRRTDSDGVKSASPITVHAFELTDGFREVETTRVTPPAGARLQNAIFSPDGKKVAWQFGLVSRPPFVDVVYRAIPFLQKPPARCVGLWTSRLNGTEMREIGRFEYDETSRGPAGISHLAWLTDGKRLSFFIEGPGASGAWRSSLYVVNAE